MRCTITSWLSKNLQRNKKELQHLSGSFELFIAYGMKLLKSISGEIADNYLNQLQYEEHFPGKPWLLKVFSAKNRTPAQGAGVLLH
ncbi:MAG: hypothetical protein V4615_01755 [Bacteroidota bacterium]